jgi:ubiquinone/menaquinone biosynthesis C-methylase UbiE
MNKRSTEKVKAQRSCLTNVVWRMIMQRLCLHLGPGLRVLDVGCGTGAISKDIAAQVGDTGHVTGIDNTEYFIQSGKETYADVKNLDLIYTDLFAYEPEEKFDLIVAARVLQWLNNPVEALKKMYSLLKPGGMVSILDYNHEALGMAAATAAKHAAVLCYLFKMARRCRHEQPHSRRPARIFYEEAGFANYRGV